MSGPTEFDLTEVVLGEPIQVLRSPLEEQIEKLVDESVFEKLVFSVPYAKLIRLWHPRISSNGVFDCTLVKQLVFFLRPYCDDDERFERLPFFNDLLHMLIDFYGGVFPSNKGWVNHICPLLCHIKVMQTYQVYAVISYIVDKESNSVVVVLIGVDKRFRGRGYGSFLWVALLKTLIGSGFEPSVEIFLQCMSADRSGSDIGYFTRLGFVETSDDMYAEDDPCGLLTVPPGVRNLVNRDGLCTGQTRNREVRWVRVSGTSFHIPECRRKLLMQGQIQQLNHTWYHLYSDKDYCRFHDRTVPFTAAQHCCLGLHLLMYPQEGAVPINRQFTPPLWDNSVYGLPKPVLVPNGRYLDGYITYHERATMAEDSWMTSNLMDATLSVMRLDGRVKYFVIGSQMTAFAVKTLDTYVKFIDTRTFDLTCEEGVRFVEDLHKIIRFLLGNSDWLRSDVIFMPLHMHGVHWTGMFAFNPLVVLDESSPNYRKSPRKTETEAFGWVYFDPFKNTDCLNQRVPDRRSNPFFFMLDLLVTVVRLFKTGDDATSIPSWDTLADFYAWLQHTDSKTGRRICSQFCDCVFLNVPEFPRYLSVSTSDVRSIFQQNDTFQCGYILLLFLTDLDREVKKNGLKNFKSSATRKCPIRKCLLIWISEGYSLGQHITDDPQTQRNVAVAVKYEIVMDFRRQVLCVLDRLAFTWTDLRLENKELYELRRHFEDWLLQVDFDRVIETIPNIVAYPEYYCEGWAPLEDEYTGADIPPGLRLLLRGTDHMKDPSFSNATDSSKKRKALRPPTTFDSSVSDHKATAPTNAVDPKSDNAMTNANSHDIDLELSDLSVSSASVTKEHVSHIDNNTCSIATKPINPSTLDRQGQLREALSLRQQEADSPGMIPLGFFRDPQGNAWAASLQHPNHFNTQQPSSSQSQQIAGFDEIVLHLSDSSSGTEEGPLLSNPDTRKNADMDEQHLSLSDVCSDTEEESQPSVVTRKGKFKCDETWEPKTKRLEQKMAESSLPLRRSSRLVILANNKKSKASQKEEIKEDATKVARVQQQGIELTDDIAGLGIEFISKAHDIQEENTVDFISTGGTREGTEEKPRDLADSGASVLDSIQDYTVPRIPEFDTEVVCGKNNQLLDVSFEEFVSKCLASQEPPMESTADTLENIRFMEGGLKKLYEQRECELYSHRRTKLTKSIKETTALLADAKESFKKNMEFFRREFLKSTSSTLQALSYIGKSDKEPWMGKFQYKSKKSGKIITELIPLDENWVTLNIEESYIDAVRKLSIEIQQTGDNFLRVPPVQVSLDKRKIIKAKYTPQRIVRGKLLKTEDEAIREKIVTRGLYRKVYEKKTIPPSFFVMYDDHTVQPIDRDILVGQFGLSFVTMIENMQGGGGGGGDGSSRSKKSGFASVPIEESVNRSWGPAPVSQTVPVPNKYHQGESNTCVFTSFASALYHGGLQDAADEIFREGQTTYLGVGKPLLCLLEKIQSMKIQFRISKLKEVNRSLDFVLQSVNPLSGHRKTIFLIVLGGSDGSRDHAITILDGLIFDANELNTMPLCKENMDYCCSDMTGETVFQKIVLAYSFVSTKIRCDGVHDFSTQKILNKFHACNQDNCVFASLASALDYAGLFDASKEIIMQGQSTTLTTSKAVKYVLQKMQSMKMKFRITKLKRENKTFEKILDSVKPNSKHKKTMFLIVLQASKGSGGDHALTVFDGLIFDSNNLESLPLTTENIECCCSHVKGVSVAARISLAYSVESSILLESMKS